MAKERYALNPGEKIVYKTSCVRHGFWSPYTNVLTVTNQSVICEKYGTFNNFKGIERYNYSDISQAIQGEASNGESQLELYIGGSVENFALRTDDETELRVLIAAINDQMGNDAGLYNYDYYQSLKDTDRIAVLREKAQNQVEERAYSDGDALKFAETTAKRFIKSGDFSVKGVTKAFNVNGGAQSKKKNGIFSGMMDTVLEELGVRDIQDEFIEMGNEFREEFGLPTKMTYAEKKELEELEKKQRKKSIQQQRNIAFQERTLRQKASITHLNEESQRREESLKMSVKEQMEVLQQMKMLLDAGALTQEEFEAKKQEILNS